jgi:lipid-binding SYLF domain-containing protein
MTKFAKFAAAVAVALGLFGMTAPAYAAGKTDLLADSADTVRHVQNSPQFGDARRAMRHARAVLIVPALVKAGFIFGGEGGDGVLLARTRGGWSNPAYYTLGSASFGFQAGIEQAEVVMIINSDRALRAIERSKFKIGAGLGLTVVTLGAGVEGATSGNLQGDIIVWSKAKGLYGGISINGSVVAPDDKENSRSYGTTSVSSIVTSTGKYPQADALRRKLSNTF